MVGPDCGDGDVDCRSECCEIMSCYVVRQGPERG